MFILVINKWEVGRRPSYIVFSEVLYVLGCYK